MPCNWLVSVLQCGRVKCMSIVDLVLVSPIVEMTSKSGCVAETDVVNFIVHLLKPSTYSVTSYRGVDVRYIFVYVHMCHMSYLVT